MEDGVGETGLGIKSLFWLDAKQKGLQGKTTSSLHRFPPLLASPLLLSLLTIPPYPTLATLASSGSQRTARNVFSPVFWHHFLFFMSVLLASFHALCIVGGNCVLERGANSCADSSVYHWGNGIRTAAPGTVVWPRRWRSRGDDSILSAQERPKKKKTHARGHTHTCTHVRAFLF